MNRTDETVFVDINTMNTWETKITEITSLGEEVLEVLDSEANSLSDCWQGGSATGFIESYTAFIKELKASCAKLSNFKNLLECVVQTMENE